MSQLWPSIARDVCHNSIQDLKGVVNENAGIGAAEDGLLAQRFEAGFLNRALGHTNVSSVTGEVVGSSEVGEACDAIETSEASGASGASETRDGGPRKIRMILVMNESSDTWIVQEVFYRR